MLLKKVTHNKNKSVVFYQDGRDRLQNANFGKKKKRTVFSFNNVNQQQQQPQ